MRAGSLRVFWLSLGFVVLGCPKPGPSLSSISVAPENALVAQGDSVHFVATGLYSDGSVKTITDAVAWLVDDAIVAKMDPADPGKVEALKPGSTVIHASSGTVQASRTMTVTEATIRFLQIYPPRPVAPVGLQVQLQVFAVHTDKTVENITASALWSSSDVSLFAVDQGRIDGLTPGTGELSVTYQGALTKVPLIVTNATVQRLDVQPPAVTVPAGVSQQLAAVATLSDRTTLDVTTIAEWASASAAIATVTTFADASGLVTGVAPGATTVSATVPGQQGRASVLVTSAVLRQLVVSPSPAAAAKGTQVELTATGVFSDGSSSDVSALATWSSSADDIASVQGHLATAHALGHATITASFQGKSGATTLTVSDARLSRLELGPSPVSIARGTSQRMAATGVFTDGSLQDLTNQAVWTVGAEALATVSNAPGAKGEVLGLNEGTTTITAEVGAVAGTGSLTITPAIITKIEVSPTTPSVPVGTSSRLTATGIMSDGTTQDLTTSASWTSSEPSVLTASSVDGTRGLVTGRREGSVLVSASFSGLTGSTTVTVSAAVLVTLSIAPSPVTLALGTRGSLGAMGIYSDNTTMRLTDQVTWTVDDATVASVDNATGHQGEARALKVGGTVVHAQLGLVATTATVTVTPAVLSTIEVSPATSTVAAGFHKTFIALATMSDHTTQDVTGQATWTSSAPSVASVSNAVGAHGVAAGLLPGSTTITATLSGISGSGVLTVTPALLLALAVEPPTLSLYRGSSGALTARGTYSDGTSLDVTAQVTWSSSADAVATVSNASGTQGHLVAAGVGDATITAQLQAITADATVTVTPALLVGLDVTPITSTAPLGTTVALTATGRFNDGSTQDLTQAVAWTSSAPSVANVSISPGTEGHAAALTKGTATITAAIGSQSGDATIHVTDAALARIALSPQGPSLAPLTSVRLTATGTWTDGSTQDLTTQATWASDAPSIAAVSNVAPSQGRVSAQGTTGTASVSATFSGITGSTVVTVTGATLLTIDLTPSAPSAPAGLTVALTATGSFSDGSTQNLTDQVAWSSTDSSRASVSNGPVFGVVTAVAVGAPTISATALGVTGNVTFTTTSAALLAIDLTPPSATLPLGLTQGFTATGTFSDGSTAPITTDVVWSSSDPAIASVSNASGTEGLVTGRSVGHGTISASLLGRTRSAAVTVSPAILVALAVTPVNPSVPRGLTVQFAATGTYSDGSTQDVTQTATWTVDDQAVASISNGVSRGLATGLAIGQTTVRATLGVVPGSSDLTVTPALLSAIGVVPVNPSVPLGLTQHLTATGVYTDGTTQALTSLATWSTSDGTVATVSNAVGSEGLATTLSRGTTTLTATFGGRSGSTQLTVSAAVLQSIEVTPPAPSLPAGRTLQLTATGLYSDTTTQILTASVAWSTSAPSIAVVSNASGSEGLATAQAEGSATLTASLSGHSGSVVLSVSPAVLQAVQVTPANSSRPRGLAQLFTATGLYSNGTTQTLTTSVTWVSSDAAISSISNAAGSQGRASSLSVGTVTISASLDGVTGSTPFTVTAAELTRVDVTPKTSSAPLGSVRQLTATGTYTDGTTQNLTAQASWTSSNPGWVSVSNAAGSQGLATTIGTGTVTISASVQGFTDTMSLTVTQAALASIDLSPINGSTALGYTRQLMAVGTYTDGTTQVLTNQVTWSSSDPQTAFVSNGAPSKGLLSTVAVGSVTVSAAFAGVIGSTGHTVTPAVLLSIDVSPSTVTLSPPATRALTAQGSFSDGSTQDLTTSVTWSSSNALVAQVSNVAPQGLVTAIGSGGATITAALGAHVGVATVSVP